MITFEDFMLSVSYGTKIKAIAQVRQPNRHHSSEGDEILCTNPSAYFGSPLPDVKAFSDKYRNWDVHGIHTEGDTIVMNLYPN